MSKLQQCNVKVTVM